MSLPQVVIVGRPNVGKSSLFNWLSGRRIAIVDPTAGVTRDRISTVIQADDLTFELSDTGGLGVQDVDNLTEDIERQIDFALVKADVILFVLDIRDGLTPLDEHVADKLRKLDKPTIYIANKCDAESLQMQASDFFKLGQDRIICVSAQQKLGKRELWWALKRVLPKVKASEAPGEPEMKLAIVGRRNTGKSTFINCLANEERVIVSEVPGTTRDSIDVRFECDGKSFIAIDTAGVRRKSSLANDIEFYSSARAERSIRRADVVLLFLEPRWKISKVDKQLAEYVLENHKPVIFVINKWDLVKDIPTEKFGTYIRKTFPSLDYPPIAFITAKVGKNAKTVLNLAQNLHKQSGQRVGTGDLNRVLRAAVEAKAPPFKQNRQGKIFFATQADVHPPTLVLFTNGEDMLDKMYQRYLIKTFRDQLPFAEVPIKLILRSKQREERTGDRREPVAARLEREEAAREEVKTRRGRKKKVVVDEHEQPTPEAAEPSRPKRTKTAPPTKPAKPTRKPKKSAEPRLWTDV